LDQRCKLGIVYPAIDVISWRLNNCSHRIHPLSEQVAKCGKFEKIQQEMAGTRECHNDCHSVLSSGLRMYSSTNCEAFAFTHHDIRLISIAKFRMRCLADLPSGCPYDGSSSWTKGFGLAVTNKQTRGLWNRRDMTRLRYASTNTICMHIEHS